MAAVVESPALYGRDLRSANTEWKRTKDSAKKWTYGSRHLAGVHTVWRFGGITSLTGSPSQHAKTRPEFKYSDQHRHYRYQKAKQEHNIVKPRSRRYESELPIRRTRTTIDAQLECREGQSLDLDDLDSISSSRRTAVAASNPRAQSFSDTDVLYSFDDRHDTPGFGAPLTLDVFVKTDARETEKFVEKEYGILGVDGELVTGRKARRNLRKTVTELAAGDRKSVV